MNRKERRAAQKGRKKQLRKLKKESYSNPFKPDPVVHYIGQDNSEPEEQENISLKEMVLKSTDTEAVMNFVARLEHLETYGEEEFSLRNQRSINNRKLEISEAPCFNVTQVAKEFDQIKSIEEEDSFNWESLRLCPPANKFWMELDYKGEKFGAFFRVDKKWELLKAKPDTQINTELFKNIPQDKKIITYCFYRTFKGRVYKSMELFSFETGACNKISDKDLRLLHGTLEEDQEAVKLNEAFLNSTFSNEVARENNGNFFHNVDKYFLFSLGVLGASNTKIKNTISTSTSRFSGKSEPDPNRVIIRTVTIDIKKEQTVYSKGHGKGDSRAKHFVRGHIRHYQSGKSTYVRPHYRGSEEFGIVHHDYKLV